MKPRYRIYRRSEGIFYLLDTLTKKRESLQTTTRDEAERIVQARNEALRQPLINLQIARAYLTAGDPEFAKRTWQHVMSEAGKMKQGVTKERWDRAMTEKSFNSIRSLPLLSTHGEHLIKVLETGTISTNIFLRRLHNFALDMNWIPVPIIPKRQWPRIQFSEKRGITTKEHQAILQGERDSEWISYYQLLWHLGGSQTDIASLKAENINWTNRTISYTRQKSKSVAILHFGDAIASVLASLPSEGNLFQKIGKWKESDRAKAFIRRCRLVGVKGVSLHCYRYGWAERARACGFPERFAQEALGHGSKAVHRAYARNALVKIPSLEEYEQAHDEKILKLA